jgi:hypothetical protein
MILTFTALLSILSNISEVRNIYKEAIENSEKADQLVAKTQSQKSNALMHAYYGTGVALQAKHSWSPSTKLSKAKAAAIALNAAVNASPTDLEIRFLRFSFEANIPSFLDMSEHLDADKKWILANKNAAHPMWPTIQKFLKNCDQLTAAEKGRI